MSTAAIGALDAIWYAIAAAHARPLIGVDTNMIVLPAYRFFTYMLFIVGGGTE